FIVALDGVPVVVDAGRTTYTARTFGPDRYSIPAMRSEFHNLPVIAGQGQGLGERFAARHVDVDLGDGRSRFTADLAGAYPAGLVQTWRRTVALERRPAPSAADDVPFGRRAERDARVVVADEWVGAEDVVSRHVLAGDVVERLDNGLVVRTLGGGLFQWRWDPGLQAELEGWELEDPLLTRVWGDRLTVLALDASGRDRLTVTGRRHEQKRT
ncbi:MAG: heparinase II/III-family protein, partial [Propionibacteriaceae bacterium]|nr:heparinase II/III-family protein [Propionibacteriaceae bacterium]